MLKEKAIRIGYDEKGVYTDIKGEATVKQSNALKQFLFDVIEKFHGIKNLKFYMNLEDCLYIDSTFIGLLLILDKKIKESIQTSLIILKPSGYVLEVIHQMGLENILDLQDDGPFFPRNMEELQIENINKLELAMMMYLAHSELAGVNEDNKAKFDAAIHMLKKEIENEGFDISKLDMFSR